MTVMIMMVMANFVCVLTMVSGTVPRALRTLTLNSYTGLIRTTLL